MAKVTYYAYGYIGEEVTLRGLQDALFENGLSHSNITEADELEILINSGGGSIFEGMAMIDYLDRLPCRKSAQILGIAASMASVLACACDRVDISSNSYFMIHNPWTFAMGDSEDLRKSADLMDQMKKKIIGLYKRKSDLDDDQLSLMMDDETWLTGDECKAKGFNFIVTDEQNMAAKLDEKTMKYFNKMPDDLKRQKEEQMEFKAKFEESEKKLIESEAKAKDFEAKLTTAEAKQKELEASNKELIDAKAKLESDKSALEAEKVGLKAQIESQFSQLSGNGNGTAAPKSFKEAIALCGSYSAAADKYPELKNKLITK